jgi:hypothetical protein
MARSNSPATREEIVGLQAEANRDSLCLADREGLWEQVRAPLTSGPASGLALFFSERPIRHRLSVSVRRSYDEAQSRKRTVQ